MNDRPDAEGQRCFTDFALQEYTLGRLDAEVRLELEAHLGHCPECAACVSLLSKETEILRDLLACPRGTGKGGPVLDDETLALYVDDGLDAEERQRCDEVLATSLEARCRLLALVEQVRTLKAPAEDRGAADPAQATKAPEGLILRMPKRAILPRSILDLPDAEAQRG